MGDQPERAAPARETGTALQIGAYELECVRRRRQLAGGDPARRPWALALSGGGIRSATFNLGLLRALASTRLLKDFDYLSTVSGGGYIGAALGRLYSRSQDAEKVMEGLARDDSRFLWWLRRNGRFLVPAGMRDVLLALTGALRGVLSTHAEVAVLCLLMACAVMAPHLFLSRAPMLGHPLSAFGAPWFALLVPIAFAAATVFFAYWFTRDAPEDPVSVGRGPVLAAFAAAALLLLAFFSREGLRSGLFAAGAAFAAHATGAVLTCWLNRNAADPRERRIQLTRWLSAVLLAGLVVALLGVVDFLSWSAAYALSVSDPALIGRGFGGAALLLAMLRAAAPAAGQLRGLPGMGVLLNLGNVVGLLLAAAVFLLWMTIAQWFVWFAPALVMDPSRNAPLPWWPTELLSGPVSRWGVLFGALVAYAAMSGRNVEQLNRASLHSFYRSRLARAYVSVGNVNEGNRSHNGRRFNFSLLEPRDRTFTEDASARGTVRDLHREDDVRMAVYRPYEYGGPIHLINCCINQTIDDRTETYNADRKGVPLTLSALGLEIGTRPPKEDCGDTWLAQWIAVSGAAVASGMGSYTRPGIAVLCFLTGLRLGYWWHRGHPWSAFDKYGLTLREMFGRFPGLRKEVHYLSDGGHFDNTGVYACLKRRPEVIVAADCGADPGYVFADLENLIRKARIDYDAEIEFIDPASFVSGIPPHPVAGCIGTPDSITAEPGKQFLLLGRITYCDGSSGILLVIKPRRLMQLPLDITGYSDRNLLFPQQTTGDLFFDEAQWESYAELGYQLGVPLTPQLIGDLQSWARQGRPVAAASLSPPVTGTASVVGSRRFRISTTVGTTLSVSAVLAVLLAAWPLSRTDAAVAERTQAEAVAALFGTAAGGAGLIDAALTSTQPEALLPVVHALQALEVRHHLHPASSAWQDLVEMAIARCRSRKWPGSSHADTDEACVPALTLLADRPTRTARLLHAYWYPLLRPAGGQGTVCRSGLDNPTYLMLYGNQRRDRGTDTLPSELSALARRHGLGIEHRRLPRGLNLGRPVLLTSPGAKDCAAWIRQRMGILATDVISLPRLNVGYESVHLWLSPQLRPDDVSF